MDTMTTTRGCNHPAHLATNSVCLDALADASWWSRAEWADAQSVLGDDFWRRGIFRWVENLVLAGQHPESAARLVRSAMVDPTPVLEPSRRRSLEAACHATWLARRKAERDRYWEAVFSLLLGRVRKAYAPPVTWERSPSADDWRRVEELTSPAAWLARRG